MGWFSFILGLEPYAELLNMGNEKSIILGTLCIMIKLSSVVHCEPCLILMHMSEGIFFLLYWRGWRKQMTSSRLSTFGSIDNKEQEIAYMFLKEFISLKIKFNSQNPRAWQPRLKERETYYGMSKSHIISLFFIFYICWSQIFRVSRSVQHNTLTELSRKIMLSWSICIETVEDSVDIVCGGRAGSMRKENFPTTPGSKQYAHFTWPETGSGKICERCW